MRKFIISSKYFFILLTVAFVVIPVIYSFQYDYMTTMQILKKFWYCYIMAGIFFCVILFFITMENDY